MLDFWLVIWAAWATALLPPPPVREAKVIPFPKGGRREFVRRLSK